jgi:hypothetical protein
MAAGGGWLAIAGATIKEIQEAAGYKTITMAARYSHLSPVHRLAMVEQILCSLLVECVAD